MMTMKKKIFPESEISLCISQILQELVYDFLLCSLSLYHFQPYQTQYQYSFAYQVKTHCYSSWVFHLSCGLTNLSILHFQDDLLECLDCFGCLMIVKATKKAKGLE